MATEKPKTRMVRLYAVNVDHQEPARVTFLPMIDMDHNNMSCVYSTLTFVAKKARQYGLTPVVTFDQPLWWKAQLVIDNLAENDELKSIELRLWGFHTEISFL